MLGGAAICGVRGQFFFAFIVEGVGDFLGKTGTISEFVMEEMVGGDVPAFSLKFKTAEIDVITKMTEGATIQCFFGKDIIPTEFKYAEMQIAKISTQIEKSDFIAVEIKGLIKNGLEYLRDNEQRSYPKSLSTDVLAEVGGKYFEVVTWMSENANDAMTWIRPNHSPKRFVADLCKNSYINDTNAIVHAIEMSGKFLITDIRQIASQPVKWFLLNHDPDTFIPHTANFDPNYRVVSDFGLMNNMVTNPKHTPIHSCTDGEAKKVTTPEMKPIIISGNQNLAKGSPTKFEVEKIIDTDNFHDNYSKSRLVTVPNNAMLNSLEIEVTIENMWQDYLLLDLIHFTPWRPGVLVAPEVKSLGGIYAITKISRYYAQNRAAITITISRDGMNDMSGSLGWF